MDFRYGDYVALVYEDVALELAPDLEAALWEGGLSEEAVELGDPVVFVLGVGVRADGVGAVDALCALGDGEDGEAALLAVEVEAGAGAVPFALVDEVDAKVDAEVAELGLDELAAGGLTGAAEVAPWRSPTSSRPRP